MRILHLSIFFILVVLTLSFVSAGLFGDLWGKVTGWTAHTGSTNVTVGVSGTNPVTIVVVNATITGTTNDPTEDSLSTILFFVNVSDTDGVNDINDSSVNVSVAFFNQSLFSAKRTNSTCVLVGDLNANTANFSCTITMYYYYANGIWNITVSARDLGVTTIIYSTTTTFTYDQLKAIKISPSALTFASVAPGATNITSNNDPTVINNTGNFNVTSGGIEITATNLIGVSVPADLINVSNFSISIVDNTSGNESCVGQTTPANFTSTAISGSVMSRGNNSLNNADSSSGQEQIYYCIREIPTDISSQSYSSALTDNGYGAWTITMA